jgi:glycosyltransferase domain-containing protein
MITLLVPTLNRSQFVIRLLGFYRDVGFKGTILIGDSSGEEHLARTKAALKAVGSSVDWRLMECPGMNNALTTQRLLRSTTTPYAVLLPDDDFIMPGALEDCVQFLDHHPEYVAAHGVGVVIRLSVDGPYGDILCSSYYPQPEVEERTAAERLTAHMKDYTVGLFSVHRTATWSRIYRYAGDVDDAAIGLELLPCCLSVTEGKIKQLDRLYLVRQDHAERYLLPDVFDWIAAADWHSSYAFFRKAVGHELVCHDGLCVEEAEKIVKRAFWSYLARYIVRNSPQPYPRWRELMARIPGARAAARALRRLVSQRRHRFMVESLTRPGSKYHSDFMAVYQSVTGSHGMERHL